MLQAINKRGVTEKANICLAKLFEFSWLGEISLNKSSDGAKY
jgi:hypothetical protein